MRNLLFTLGLLVATVVPKTGHAQSIAELSKRRCADDAPKCWYFVFNVGDEPKREYMLANWRVGPEQNGVKTTQMIHLFEHDADTSYLVYNVEVRCRTKQTRINGSYGVGIDGKLTRSDLASPWTEYETHFLSSVVPLLCDPTAIDHAQELAIMLVGEYYRPADMAAVMRRVFFHEPIGTP